MEIRNYTPRMITIVDEHGKLVASYPPSEEPALATRNLDRLGTVDGVIIYRPKYKLVKSVPDPEEDPESFYIVDQDAAEAMSWRTDLLVPHQPIEHTEYEHAYQSLINI